MLRAAPALAWAGVRAALLLVALLNSRPLLAQVGGLPPASQPAVPNTFEVRQPDFKLSPHTGLTRRHWQDAAQYLLAGAFSYVHGLDDPLVFPQQPGKSYPRTPAQLPTERLEGLCRTLFIAVPLLRENPELAINGIPLAAYYRHHLGLLLDPASASYIRPRAKSEPRSQPLVEFGGLAVALFAAPEVLWDPLPPAQKDGLAALMLSYGDGPTVASNWQFFNIFVLSFCQSRGYAVNEKQLRDFLGNTLALYRGEGWYNDNPAYDYYSAWAFQLYGTLWSEFYGRQHYPALAAQFAAHLQESRNNYPLLFSRDGQMIMWGRSISYRFGAIVPLPLLGLHPAPDTNYGWLRRISSGVLLQFLENPAFLQDRVPTLGFYGAFEPAVQGYSCRGSAFWAGKAFLGLLVPADSPFWTATENEGPWVKELATGTVRNTFQPGSGILITDYPNSGTAEIRAWCHAKAVGVAEPFRATENYNRLAYNSAFPWQADGPRGEVAMNYVFRNRQSQWEALRLFTFRRFEDGVYYRDAVLETDTTVRLHLADVPLPNGILRLDEVSGPAGTPLRLGHYALPALNGPIRRESRSIRGHRVQLLSNGVYQLALVPLSGWDTVEVADAEGLHPVARQSAVIDAVGTLTAAHTATLYATMLLWKKAGQPWTDDELLPVRRVQHDGPHHRAEVTFADGRRQLIAYP